MEIPTFDLITIRHLRYFKAVAEARSFSAAARVVGVSQPNMSQQMRGLEDKFGVVLFRRAGNRTLLTDSGEVFHQLALMILGQFDELFRTGFNIPPRK